MGWASGSCLGGDLWHLVREFIPKDKRVQVAREFYDILCDADADDWQEDDELVIDAQLMEDEE